MTHQNQHNDSSTGAVFEVTTLFDDFSVQLVPADLPLAAETDEYVRTDTTYDLEAWA